MRHLVLTLLVISNFIFFAHAQNIEVADGKTSKVKISVKELNRIKVAGGRIDNVRAPSGLMVLETDAEKGEVFLRPTTTKSFSVFISADNDETYTLLLTPADVPALNLVLKPISGASALPLADEDSVSPYVKRIKALMRVMQKDSGKYHKVDLDNAVIFDHDLQLGIVKEKQWPSAPGRLKGEAWRLVNNSQKPVQLKEREFLQRYKDGEPVVAVAIEKHVLQPTQSTKVLIISRGQ